MWVSATVWRESNRRITNYPDYQGRRDYLHREFTPLLDFLEGIPPEAGQSLFPILNTLPDWEHVTHEWNKARRRLASDPDGAITSARALLESVCKHILAHRKSRHDLPSYENTPAHVRFS